jgi:hypothetical protein
VRMLPAPPDTLRLLPLPIPEPALDPPDWVRALLRKYKLRITDWMTQAWAMTLSPRRFMEEWATGRREALTPTRFLAVSLGLSLLIDRAGRYLFHVHQAADGVGAWLSSSSAGLTAAMFVFGAMTHVTLRLKSKQPLRSSVAALFFATGPGTLIAFVGWLITAALYVTIRHVPTFERDPATPIPVSVLGIVHVAWSVAALAGVHRVRWWWPAVAMVAIPLFFGVVGLIIGVLAAFTMRRLGLH